jgi:acetoacetyl-CoA synthetase
VGGSAAAAEKALTFRPEPAVVEASQLSGFMRFCESSTGLTFLDHPSFHEFSVADQRRFWHLFLSWSGLLREGSPEPVCTDDACERAMFFPELELSYAENLLRINSQEQGERTALVAHHASGAPERLSRRELRGRVQAVAAHLRGLGVKPGDRVAAVSGNNAEVAIAALASAAVGAPFASAAPDLGAPALLSRFEQLSPTVLMAGLTGGGSEATSTALCDRAAEVAQGLPTLTAFVALDDGPEPRGLAVPVHRLSEMLEDAAAAVEWERFPFNHPLFVMFTSGTTGPPKCIVHGAGGTLLEHVKEHRLHVDLQAGDRLFFHTSAAWMMWNWQLSALASGAEVMVYDGPVAGPATLWELVSRERVNVFGTSPPYLQLCEDSGYSPGRELELGDLRAVLSTGSILHDWQYDWFAEHVGHVPLQSISGGTDIIGCFVLGNPNLPVRRGRIQCRSLGMDVQAVAGHATPSGSAIGELVCRNPFPSRPLHFLRDDGGARFHAAYFEQNPGVWTHGDLIEFDDDGHARIHGRSDGVLKVHGLRIGPAEIYRALRDVPEVREAMAVEQPSEVRGQARLVLLVVLRDEEGLDGRLIARIRREIVRYASPGHVPELVVQVEELPTTHSGKRSERAARDAVSGIAAANAEALANPGSLERIRLAVDAALARRPEVGDELALAGESDTVARLRPIWEAVLGISPLRSDDNFFDVGGTSLGAVRLLQAIHERMAVDLPLSALLDAPTIAAMAAVIDSPELEPRRPLVLLRPGAEDRPLFLVHSLYGDVLSMRPLALGLATDRAVYGLQARGLDPAEQPHTRVEDMAVAYVESIRSIQEHGPYALGGHSLGGLVAFETARRLERLGEEVEWLGLIDTEIHHSCLPARARLRWLAARLRRLIPVGGASAGQAAPDWQVPPRMQRLEAAGWEAYKAYCPGPYGGSATLFRAEVTRDHMGDPLPLWRRVVRGGLTVEPVTGRHADVVAEPHVRVLAERVSASLDRVAAAR